MGLASSYRRLQPLYAGTSSEPDDQGHESIDP